MVWVMWTALGLAGVLTILLYQQHLEMRRLHARILEGRMRKLAPRRERLESALRPLLCVADNPEDAAHLYLAWHPGADRGSVIKVAKELADGA